MPGETVVYRASPSKMEFSSAIFLFIISGWMMAVGNMLAPWGYLVLFMACATAFGAGLRYRNLELAITDKRILAESGAISPQWLSIPLGQVKTIGVDQGMMGRIFGYGAITVSGTGGPMQKFHRIAAPEEFRRLAQDGMMKPF